MKKQISHVKELFNQAIASLKELLSQHNQMTKSNIDKAEASIDKRLEGMNEFREQQKDIIKNFATNERVLQLEKELEKLNLWKSKMEGIYIAIIFVWPAIVGIVTLLIARSLK